MNIKDDEVRNFQTDMASKFGTEVFVDAWNRFYPTIHGTYNNDTGFYAIINTKYKLTKEL